MQLRLQFLILLSKGSQISLIMLVASRSKRPLVDRRLSSLHQLSASLVLFLVGRLLHDCSVLLVGRLEHLTARGRLVLLMVYLGGEVLATWRHALFKGTLLLCHVQLLVMTTVSLWMRGHRLRI